MEETKMKESFAENCKANIVQLIELFQAYDLAKLGYDMQEQRSTECYDEVLRNTPFYAAHDGAEVKVGERITKEFYSFLMSKEDFQRYLKLGLVVLAREGITDSEGYYITDWLKIRGDAKRELVDFIIRNLVPESLRETFEPVRRNVVQADKLIGLMRSLVQKTDVTS